MTITPGSITVLLMPTRTPEERITRLAKRLKAAEGRIDELFQMISDNEAARVEFEDETRDIANRARRAVTRMERDQ